MKTKKVKDAVKWDKFWCLNNNIKTVFNENFQFNFHSPSKVKSETYIPLIVVSFMSLMY